jgi:D-3-phosphoglycerate dehydrogenase / 2-oxoglutarate reductase
MSSLSTSCRSQLYGIGTVRVGIHDLFDDNAGMRIVVAEAIAEAGFEILRASARVDVAIGVEGDELRRRLRDADALVVRSATTVDAQLIASAPKLRVIGRAGIGVDNIDIDAATKAGVLVVNAPRANIVSAAEHTIGLLLAQARNIPQADAALRAGSWDRSRYRGVELIGKTLGIVGLGRIGTLVAARAVAFGMHLVGYDPYVVPARAEQAGVRLLTDLRELCALSDFITIHLPKTHETERLFDAGMFAIMRDGVRIVNASRGGIIDEDALAEAVRSGKVAGAALDVFETEPLTGGPLLDLPQVVLTPHLGASTREAQDRAGTDVAEAVVSALAGGLVLSAVNVDLGQDVSEEVRRFLAVSEHVGRLFVALAGGVPRVLTIHAEGQLSGYPLRPLRLSVLKGVLAGSSDEPVSYVNAETLADARGVSIEERSSSEARGYRSLLRVSGKVSGREVSVGGTVGRVPLIAGILGFAIELPLSDHLVIINNHDVPGMIGKVGIYLGELGVNIADMVLGRSSDHAGMALMALSLDRHLTDDELDGIRTMQGVEEAVSIRLEV